MKAYYDGSLGTDENGDEWITLAAISGSDKVWAEFDKRWDKMLKSRYPIAPYIHMIDLLDDKDPFEPVVGWNEDNKRALIHDAIVLLSQMDKAGFQMAISTLNESARRRWRQRGYESYADPYLTSAAGCTFLAVGGYIQNVPDDEREPIHVFYDRGEPFMGHFKDRWLRARTKPGKHTDPINNGWDLFRGVQDLDLPNCFGLQAADMVAWGHSRSLRDVERPFQYLKEWLLTVVPSQELKHTEESLRYSDPNKDTLWQLMFSKREQ